MYRIDSVMLVIMFNFNLKSFFYNCLYHITGFLHRFFDFDDDFESVFEEQEETPKPNVEKYFFLN